MIKSKLKPKKPIIVTDDQWKDIILSGQMDYKNNQNNIFMTQRTVAFVNLDSFYYGLDLFSEVENDESDFNGWNYKLKINGVQYLLLKINSIKDKYKIAYYNKNNI